MKKSYFKILSIITLAFLCLIILTTHSKGAASFNATCSGNSVNVGDTITVTVTATDAAGMYRISVNNSNVSLISGNTDEFLENRFRNNKI